MGKRKRRLLSPKYARKFVHLRETIKEVVADGVVTEEEAKKVEAAVEEVAEEVKPVVEPAPVEKKPAPKKPAPKKPVTKKAYAAVKKAVTPSKKKK
tara:strand:+ start:1127 stop:1414 length:288 start_codon:yes stop_codon:yes gene_type:complete